MSFKRHWRTWSIICAFLTTFAMSWITTSNRGKFFRWLRRPPRYKRCLTLRASSSWSNRLQSSFQKPIRAYLRMSQTIQTKKSLNLAKQSLKTVCKSRCWMKRNLAHNCRRTFCVLSSCSRSSIKWVVTSMRALAIHWTRLWTKQCDVSVKCRVLEAWARLTLQRASIRRIC